MALAVHRVRSGDTLYGIARSAGVEVNQLLAMNPELRTNPDAIKPGKALRLRAVSPSRGAPTASLSSTFISGATTTRPSAHSRAFPFQKGNAHLEARHVEAPLTELDRALADWVQPPRSQRLHLEGPSMVSLTMCMTGIRTSVRCSTSYSPSPPRERHSNAGAKLHAPPKTWAVAETSSTAKHAGIEESISAVAALKAQDTPSPWTRPTSSSPPKRRMHTVASGETLHGIARRYSVPLGSILALNNITEKNSAILQSGRCARVRSVCIA
mmetsp:Transcript_1873/g.3211  ORF Transcript_1873/g.3211 Transcript_1873/m.3211 type:complete len:269 (+) Transcript_1873:66-872(+)